MCTVTWFHEEGGYQLFVNRDERLDRTPAAPPEENERQGVRYLAPRDGQCGGTWIAVNEFGLGLCLVNLAPARSLSRSRGLLVRDWIASCSPEEVYEHAERTQLADYAPFALVVLAPGTPASLVRWDGRRAAAVPDAGHSMPLCSSSLDAERAAGARRQLMSAVRATAGRLHTGALLAFHRSHSPEAGPWSVCMHREDAATVSFTWLTVRGPEACMYYAEGRPCQSLAGRSVSMALCAREDPCPV